MAAEGRRRAGSRPGPPLGSARLGARPSSEPAGSPSLAGACACSRACSLPGDLPPTPCGADHLALEGLSPPPGGPCHLPLEGLPPSTWRACHISPGPLPPWRVHHHPQPLHTTLHFPLPPAGACHLTPGGPVTPIITTIISLSSACQACLCLVSGIALNDRVCCFPLPRPGESEPTCCEQNSPSALHSCPHPLPADTGRG